MGCERRRVFGRAKEIGGAEDGERLGRLGFGWKRRGATAPREEEGEGLASGSGRGGEGAGLQEVGCGGEEEGVGDGEEDAAKVGDSSRREDGVQTDPVNNESVPDQLQE